MKVNTSLCFAVQITRSSIKPWSDDGHGLNHIINLRQRQYIRQQAERKLKKDNRVALLGRGIALVKTS